MDPEESLENAPHLCCKKPKDLSRSVFRRPQSADHLCSTFPKNRVTRLGVRFSRHVARKTHEEVVIVLSIW